MEKGKKKLNEMAFWIVLLIVCVFISILYLVKDSREEQNIDIISSEISIEGIRESETKSDAAMVETEAQASVPDASTEETQKIQEIPDMPSGVVEIEE